ncbi:MAG: glycosyltransferase family 2 protein [Bacteroidales bacterium]|nr:glycosyltransferase family 2 protein [Bacteroidales bacterium]
MAQESKRAFSVIMPTYNQCAFIRRAIASLQLQTYPYWELIIVNDGCTDRTRKCIEDLLDDPRIRYMENDCNRGIGYALNRGIDAAANDYIAYLPSDDYFEADHLSALAEALGKKDAILAFSGVRYDDCKEVGFVDYKTCKGAIPGYCTQMVQVAHRKTADRWTEREECVSDDLFFLFWRKLTGRGIFVPTGKITCEWTRHPHQRHKICGERYGGGLNKYRVFYGVRNPIRFRSNRYKTFDEEANYAPLRETARPDPQGLKILLVGELAYNPERVHALEKAGHRLYGLWAQPRFGYSTVGPLPFGNVRDIPYDNWRETIEEIRPDVIYALLSTSAIDISHEVLSAQTGIPFVWHFKEGPAEALKAGLWSKLMDLYALADGRIYLNGEEKRWVEQFIPPMPEGTDLLLDGDMPLASSFSDNFSPKLSDTDGDIHTVVAGRIVGLSPEEYRILATSGIHLHVYSENTTPDNFTIPYLEADSTHFHLHAHCPASRWTEEFSRYDAGWLHCISPVNHGSPLRLTWADLNLPARISTYLVGGIPMIQKRNEGHLFAQRSYLDGYGVDLLYDNIDELVEKLQNRDLIRRKTANVIARRRDFSFEAHRNVLTDFFRHIIANHSAI